MEKINTIKASKFLGWYLSSSDDMTYIAARTVEELRITGKFNITVEELFDECGYIPSHICENKIEGLEEYDPTDLTFINDLNI